MKTEFNIAWVDDNFSDVQMQSTRSRLERKLKRKNGFSLDISDIFGKSREGNFEKILADLVDIVDSSNSIDLVLIDYELGKITDNDGNSLIGQDIAKRFRDTLPSVDIIFYSGKKGAEELRQILAKANVDCINCVKRENLDSDAYTIIENVINRSCKISTLRGLILNSVCEMDNMIVDILCMYYDNSTAAVRDGFVNRVAEYIAREGSNSTRNSRKSALMRKPIASLLSNKKITSGSLFIYFKNIKGQLGLTANQRSILNKYEKNILELRNSAAHTKEIICPTTKEAMLEFNEVQYRRSDIDNICTVIVSHENNIQSILDGMV